MTLIILLLGMILGAVVGNIIKNQLNFKKIMATFADIQASLTAINTEIANIPQAGTVITAAEADTIKAGIDAATAAITAKLTPAV